MICKFPVHVVCTWSAQNARINQRSLKLRPCARLILEQCLDRRVHNLTSAVCRKNKLPHQDCSTSYIPVLDFSCLSLEHKDPPSPSDEEFQSLAKTIYDAFSTVGFEKPRSAIRGRARAHNTKPNSTWFHKFLLQANRYECHVHLIAKEQAMIR